jgi:uncharacterized protein (DUF58 family)
MTQLAKSVPFEIRGATVSVNALLNIQLLAIDIERLTNDRTKSTKAGDQRSFFRGQGREFIEMKHYQNGDDVRQIDWKLTARKQSPFVRVMEEDRHAEQAIWLVLTPSCYFGTSRCLKSVLLVHWTAFLIWRFVHLKHPLKLMVQIGASCQEIKVNNKQQAALACQLLVDSHNQLAQSYTAITENAELTWPTHWRSKPNVWMLSDFQQLDSEHIKQALPIGAINRVHFLQAIDKFDKQLPYSGALPVKSNHQHGVIDTQKTSTRLAHEKTFTRTQDALMFLSHYFNGRFQSFSSQQFDWQDVITWPL